MKICFIIKQTNSGDGGKAVVVCEGEKEIINADFKNGWGTYANSCSIYTNETPRDVTLTVTPDLEDGKAFTLVAVLVAH